MRLTVLVAVASSICLSASAADNNTPLPNHPEVSELGRVRVDSLVEASGLAASRRFPGVFWTHNDGPDGILHGIRQDGSAAARVQVGAKFRDWEDVTIDHRGDLYLADVGNNSRERSRVTVYRISEPNPEAKTAAALQEWKLTFPGKPFDCETLLVWRDHGYLVSKVEEGRRPAVYRFPLTPGTKRRTLQHVFDLPIDQPVTAGDISEDGNRLAILTRGMLHIFQIDGEIEKSGTSEPQKYAIPRLQAEGCAFAEGGVVIIAETGEILLVRLTASPTTAAAQPASRG